MPPATEPGRFADLPWAFPLRRSQAGPERAAGPWPRPAGEEEARPARADHKPELCWLYPIDRRQLSAAIRFGRAAGRRERRRRPHGVWVRHLGDGRWWDAAAATWRDGCGRAIVGPGLQPSALPLERLARTRVVLAAAHRDRDPTHNKWRNLFALCQRCHLDHDRPEHLRRRRRTYLARCAVGDLFLGAYRSAWR